MFGHQRGGKRVPFFGAALVFKQRSTRASRVGAKKEEGVASAALVVKQRSIRTSRVGAANLGN
jgi:hypothetical protein